MHSGKQVGRLDVDRAQQQILCHIVIVVRQVEQLPLHMCVQTYISPKGGDT